MWTVLVVTIWLLTIKHDLVRCNKPTNDSIWKNRKHDHQWNVSHRNLQTDGIPYKVNLYLSLDYVNDTVAFQFEASEIIPSTNATIYFCYAVNKQVRVYICNFQIIHIINKKKYISY
jgi:hypothetical protein